MAFIFTQVVSVILCVYQIQLYYSEYSPHMGITFLTTRMYLMHTNFYTKAGMTIKEQRDA